MISSKADYCLGFAILPVLTVFQKHALIAFSGGFDKAWELVGTALTKLIRVKHDDIGVLTRFKSGFNPKRYIENVESSGYKLVTLVDDNYPQRLSQIFDPPFALFIKGNEIPVADNYIAIVGSRRATVYGLTISEELAQGLSEAGYCVVSGGALGIDAAAHHGALKTSTPTIAVLGCGADILYPRKNTGLLMRVANKGSVVSEYPLGTRPAPHQFPERNRIVSGLSDGVLVVEAAQGSGALITADLALSEGRTVFAVPGTIRSPYSKGPHSLIRDGAVLVECVDDIIFELNSQMRKKRKSVPKVDLSEEEEKVLSYVEWEPKTIDEIASKSSQEISKINALLAQLEVKGIVRQVEGQTYIRY